MACLSLQLTVVSGTYNSLFDDLGIMRLAMREKLESGQLQPQNESNLENLCNWSIWPEIMGFQICRPTYYQNIMGSLYT